MPTHPLEHDVPNPIPGLSIQHADMHCSSGTSVEDTTVVSTASAVTQCTSSSDHSQSDNVVSGHSEERDTKTRSF